MNTTYFTINNNLTASEYNHHHLHHQQQHLRHLIVFKDEMSTLLPLMKPDLFLNDTSGFFAVYCFVKNFIG